MPQPEEMMGARRARHRRGTVVIAIAIAAIAVLLPAFALAHIERASYWPNPGPDTSVKPAAGGSVPAVRKDMPSKKVRKHGSIKSLSKNPSIKALNKDLKTARKQGYKLRASQPAIKLSKKKAKKLRSFNIRLLRRCGYTSIQEAVTASHNNDRVEVLP